MVSFQVSLVHFRGVYANLSSPHWVLHVWRVICPKNPSQSVSYRTRLQRLWCQIFLTFTPRSLGKSSNLTSMIFRWVGENHQLVNPKIPVFLDDIFVGAPEMNRSSPLVTYEVQPKSGGHLPNNCWLDTANNVMIHAC